MFLFVGGDEWFDVLSVYWDDLVSCVSVDSWIVHAEVECFECVADDEVLEYLGLVCVGDEVHAGGGMACGRCWEYLCGHVFYWGWYGVVADEL